MLLLLQLRVFPAGGLSPPCYCYCLAAVVGLGNLWREGTLYVDGVPGTIPGTRYMILLLVVPGTK